MLVECLVYQNLSNTKRCSVVNTICFRYLIARVVYINEHSFQIAMTNGKKKEQKHFLRSNFKMNY